jgi:hypothetical protein
LIRFTEKGEARTSARNPGRTHKFAIGASVRLVGRDDSNVFHVTRQLPERAGDFQYRIKDDTCAQERVVVEFDLEASS